MNARQRPRLVDLPPPPPGKTGWPWTEESPLLTDMMADAMPWPRISIVTPSYNQGQFIEETIRSVLLQGYPNLEYIVMDGGSTDGSVEIIRQYEPWISYLNIGPDGGQAAAIAAGFAQSGGEILAWLNSDDRYLPGALDRAARFFADNPKVIFGNGDVNLIDIHGNLVYRLYAIRPNHHITANLGVHGWPQQGCFWRKAAYQRVGGVDPSLRFCMDRDLFIRLTAIGPSKRIPGPPLGDFRTHSEAKSSTILDVAQQESNRLISTYGRWRQPWQKALLRAWWWAWYKPTTLRARLHRIVGWEW